MKVKIMYRNNFHGGDGWRYYPKEIEINDQCQVCGGLRGKPYRIPFCEDGDWYDLDQWDNACGHLDTYKAVYLEAKLLLH